MVDEPRETTEQETRREPGERHPVAVAVKECHRCGAKIPEGETRCPMCGRRLYRVCYCGWRIPVTTTRCPQCEADWSNSMRVRKRAHSHRIHGGRLGSYAVTGALAALLAAGVLAGMINELALRALPEGRSLPGTLGARLALAATGVGEILRRVGQRLSEMSTELSLVLLVVLVGAAVGTAIYLMREDLLRLQWPPGGRAKGRHHRRRRAR